MARKLKSDKVLFITTVLLVCVGVVMVYSASAALAHEKYGSPYLFLTKQAMWAILGFIVPSLFGQLSADRFELLSAQRLGIRDRELLADHARDRVVAAPGRLRHDEANRLRRIVLRLRQTSRPACG